MKAVDGSLPIHCAAAKGSTAIIELLWNFCKDDIIRKYQLQSCNNEQETPFHRAAQKGRLDVSLFINSIRITSSLL